MPQKYKFTPAMREISGFGGAYEECCRRMLIAALEWLDGHPEADPRFTGYSNVYDVIDEDNEDAKALSKAACDAAGEFGTTGAMHQAVISSALWIKTHGWDAYLERMTHPGGEVGILKDKLARAEEDAARAWSRVEELICENWKRGAIIAEQVLGWNRYKVSNSQQKAYAPSQQAALEDIPLGCSLYKLVDDAIAEMTVESEAA
ncbi:hypothetical protein [Tautonia plasticadhaerens]|uniref:Uncharacterized protein n=1 Tax=Tautonia plasticadhaerens TaxID=2527974 RepID=A0A518H2A4_9BACT|nr:hypothetical protein [Tautonia plasticadhaerens]QDV34964.1 hypothetical protein ElP_28610 [Tautonia plasticadhaerens]